MCEHSEQMTLEGGGNPADSSAESVIAPGGCDSADVPIEPELFAPAPMDAPTVSELSLILH